MLTRPIPSTGEPLPVIGLGTWRAFDVAPQAAAQGELPKVLAALLAAGGKVIDTSPMYGRAERVVGELVAAAGARARVFLATKVWTRGRAAGIAQMEESERLLQTTRLDLMQVHNLLDWRTHLPALQQWKADGRVRYIGITHYTSSAYREVEEVLTAAPWDFLQINYSIDDRRAEQRLLPLAQERGVAVIANLPFGEGSVLKKKGVTARDALEFVLRHPAVTCVIPGTGKPEHMKENATVSG